MAAGSVGKSLFLQLLFHSILFITDAHKCEEISTANLSGDLSLVVHVPSWQKASAIAVCVHGGELTLWRLWGSVKVVLEFDKTAVQSYEADSCAALNPANQSWGSVLQSFVTSKNVMDRIVLKNSPFKTSCAAVEFEKRQELRVLAAFQVIDWRFPAAFLAGLIIFYNAETLSRNSVFFYSSGVSLGLIMSLLMLVYILHRLIPGRGGAYALLIGGWSVAAYLIQWTLSNLKDLIVNHNQWVIGYLVVVGIISFCVCYYHGPVKSDRGLDLIRWMLQLVGLTLLYMGTRSDVVSFGVISTVFLSHVIRRSGILLSILKLMPQNWVSYRIYYFFFPPKHKFLTQEEYVIQATEETSRALEDLREYCNSPDCNAWHVVSRLKHPTRFASFVATGQHIMDEEVRVYDDDPSPWLTSDSDGNDTDTKDDRD